MYKKQRHRLKVRLTEKGKTSKEIWMDPDVRLKVDFTLTDSLGNRLWYNKGYITGPGPQVPGAEL